MDIKQPFSYEEFRQLYSRVPRLCVDIIIYSDESILLTERNLESWNGLWHLPGGTVFYKEIAHDAVKRVAREELGVNVAIEKFLGYIEYPSEEKARGYGWSVSLAFLCRIVSGEPKPVTQAEKIAYFKKIPENTIPEQVEFLQKVLKNL